MELSIYSFFTFILKAKGLMSLVDFFARVDDTSNGKLLGGFSKKNRTEKHEKL